MEFNGIKPNAPTAERLAEGATGAAAPVMPPVPPASAGAGHALDEATSGTGAGHGDLGNEHSATGESPSR